MPKVAHSARFASLKQPSLSKSFIIAKLKFQFKNETGLWGDMDTRAG